MHGIRLVCFCNFNDLILEKVWSNFATIGSLSHWSQNDTYENAFDPNIFLADRLSRYVCIGVLLGQGEFRLHWTILLAHNGTNTLSWHVTCLQESRLCSIFTLKASDAAKLLDDAMKGFDTEDEYSRKAPSTLAWDPSSDQLCFFGNEDNPPSVKEAAEILNEGPKVPRRLRVSEWFRNLWKRIQKLSLKPRETSQANGTAFQRGCM